MKPLPEKRTHPPTLDELRAEVAAERAEAEAAYRLAIRAAIRAEFAATDERFEKAASPEMLKAIDNLCQKKGPK